MRQTYRNSERRFLPPLPLLIKEGSLIALTLILLISTTGCNRRYVVVDGGETVTVKKGDLDRIYQDNENLLKALEQCRAR